MYLAWGYFTTGATVSDPDEVPFKTTDNTYYTQDALDSFNQGNTEFTDFDKVGCLLKLSDLRSHFPSSAGQTVYVALTASATASVKNYGEEI